MSERCRSNLKDCPARHTKLGCILVSHHIFYPRSAYEEHSELASDFRELATNKVPMCKGKEMILHQEHPFGPPMPSEEVMRFCVEAERLRRELGR